MKHINQIKIKLKVLWLFAVKTLRLMKLRQHFFVIPQVMAL